MRVISVRPRLLVSIRSIAEAESALLGGADVIDIKEPSLGALGGAPCKIIRQILDFVDGRVPVSAAFGELVDIRDVNFIEQRQHLGGALGGALGATESSLMAAKIGLAGSLATTDWKNKWKSTLAALPASHSVAVAYADHATCGSPNPLTTVTCGAEFGCGYLLVDTCHKGDSLTELISADSSLGHSLDDAIAAAKRRGLRIVVAGSLRASDFRTVVGRWDPDFLAVRGAVCVGCRTGEVSETKVGQLKVALEQTRRSPLPLGGEEAALQDEDISS